MAFTQQQLEAINTTGKDILVSAAAGSGKTTILVERIIQMLIDENNLATIDTIFVSTFSRAATAEMKKRIFDALNKATEKDPKNTYLRNQLSLINRATITTLDSFFHSVVKKYFKDADIDPDFRIGSSSELEIIAGKVADEYFDELYTQGDSEFLTLADAYSTSLSENTLKKLVREISSKSENFISVEDMFNISLSNYNLNSREEYLNSYVFEKIKNEGIECLKLFKIYKEETEKICAYANLPLPNFILKDIDFYNDFESLIYSSNNKGFFDFMNSIKKSPFAQGRFTKNFPPDVKESIKDLRDSYKNVFYTSKDSFCYLDYFKSSIDELLEEYRQLYKITEMLKNLVLTYNERLLKEKKEKSIFSFSDISRFCYRLMIDEKGNETYIAKEYQKQFIEIIVDEYQDTNELQEGILSAISRKSDGIANRFMVGDIKQCIYKFRGSEPDIFKEKYDKFKNDSSVSETVIDLNKNFRSRKCVIDCINYIFKQIMNKKNGEVDYDASAMLYPGADYPMPNGDINISKNCDFYAINTAELNEEGFSEQELTAIRELNSLKNIELEANFIANKINKMINEDKLSVYDKAAGGYRPARYRDFVILSYSVKELSPVISTVFAANSIPSFCSSSKGFFDTIEIKTILALLSVIDNPYRDIELISVLHSPIYAFNADELTEIRLSSKEGYFFSAAKNYLNLENADESIKTKLLAFIEDIRRWSDLSKILSVTELLYDIYDTTCYYSYVGILTDGAGRRQSLDSLCDKARDFENAGFSGIYRFVSFVETISTADSENSSVSFSDSVDYVELMTIHKSKGLEFPFVFVVNLEKNFNFMDTRASFLMHKSLGFVPKIKRFAAASEISEDAAKILGDTLPKLELSSQYFTYASRQINRELISEKMRSLYVALTRAKEKLILVGCCDNKTVEDAKTGIIPSQVEIPSEVLKNNYMNWILKALMRFEKMDWLDSVLSFDNAMKNEPAQFNIETTGRNELIIKKLDNAMSISQCLKMLDEIDENTDYSGSKDDILSYLSYRYPYFADLKLPSTISISEIKRQRQIDIGEENDLHIYEENSLGCFDNAADSFTGNNIGENINKNPKEEFSDPDYPLPDFYFKQSKSSIGAFRGTAHHTLMEHIDFSVSTFDEIKAAVNTLVNSNILTKEQADVINIKKIYSFLNSDICARIRKSNAVYRESPFVMGLRADEIYKDEIFASSDSTILVHGIIDLYFEEDGEIVLLDYKTDRYTSDKEIEEKYKIQIMLYKSLIEKNTGKKVKESILYLFDRDKAIHI